MNTKSQPMQPYSRVLKPATRALAGFLLRLCLAASVLKIWYASSEQAEDGQTVQEEGGWHEANASRNHGTHGFDRRSEHITVANWKSHFAGRGGHQLGLLARRDVPEVLERHVGVRLQDALQALNSEIRSCHSGLEPVVVALLVQRSIDAEHLVQERKGAVGGKGKLRVEMGHVVIL